MTEISPMLHLNVLLDANGAHHAAWRHPDSSAQHALRLEGYIAAARLAEAAAFDAVFLADRLAFEENPSAYLWSPLEPLTSMAALASHTERIGLIATASTTFSEPYNLARMLGSIDLISGGRAGWNIVNSYNPDAARNFGMDELPPRSDRYSRAYEFLRVVGALWDSWDEDAIVADKSGGVYVDGAKVRPIGHRGRHFRVDGALNVPRSPQGRPVYLEAGISPDSREFAARTAEAVYTALTDVDAAVAFTQDVKRRTRANGRDPRHVLVLPGVIPYIGSTMAEARGYQQELLGLVLPSEASASLNYSLGGEYYDVDDLDTTLDAGVLPDPEALHPGKAREIGAFIASGTRTMRDVLARLDGYGHRVIVGTPELIADDFARWLQGGASDGFTLMAPLLPRDLQLFVDHVVPVLRERGLFRREYEGATLRSHYGLPDDSASEPLVLEAAEMLTTPDGRPAHGS